MQVFLDIFPVVIFFIVFKLFNVFAATAAAIAASALQILYLFIRYKKMKALPFITFLLVLILGGSTLLLHNPIYIQWKPSAIYLAFACVFLGSHWVGKKTLIQCVMGSQIELPPTVWKKINIAWALFFAAMAVLNLYVVYHFSLNAWVNFKLFGLLGLTLCFAILQAFYLAHHLKTGTK